LKNRLAVTEYDKVWNALYAETRAEFRVLFGINFQYQGASGHFVRQGFYLGRGHAAGTAPFGPEIDQHRNAGLADDLIEGGGVHVNWLSGWGQGRFTRAATSGVGEVFGCNTIIGATTRTGSNDREAHCCILKLRALYDPSRQEFF